MTQLSKRLPYPDYAPKMTDDYRLVIYDPLGSTPLITFERQDRALAGEIVALISPLYGCKNTTFAGRPDLIGVGGGEIAQLFLDDGSGLTAVSYGRVIKAKESKRDIALQNYVVSADELINARDADDRVYKNMYPNAIAFDLIQRRRHPAIRAPRAVDFPPTGGVPLPRFDACGDPLGKALGKLAEAAAVSGAVIGFGIDGLGRPFFKPNTLELAVTYQSEAYRSLEVDATGLATAVRYVVFGAPTLTPWSGGYEPKTLNYLVTPNPELNSRYESVLSVEAPRNIFNGFTGATVVAVGFTNPDNPTGSSVPATPASRTATSGLSTYALINEEPAVYGLRLIYKTNSATPKVSFRAYAEHEQGRGPYYEAELPGSEDEDKELDLLVPPADDAAAGRFLYFSRFELRVPAGGLFEIRRAHLLLLDTERLEGAAKLITKTPARLPAQITPQKIINGQLRGYLTPIGAIIDLTGTPIGDQRTGATEYRQGFLPGRGVMTVIDLGAAARSDAAALERGIRLELQNDLKLQGIDQIRQRALR